MRHLLTLLAAATACIAVADNAQDYASAANQKCPRTVSDGLVWHSVAANPQAKTIVFAMQVDDAIVPFASLKESSDMLREGKIAELLTASDAETTMLRNACLNEGYTLVYTLSSGIDSFDMTIRPSDLK